MPTYEYRCRNGHNFEVFQAMADDPVTVCEQCGAPVERVFHPIAIAFKGSGFYTTDYARKGADKADSDGGGEKKKDTDSKKSDSKTKSEGSGKAATSSKAGD